MSDETVEIRKLNEQFEPKTVSRIRALQADTSSLPFKDGAGGYYAKELIYSLEAGLFLASLNLASSLLELFVRDLLIYVSSSNNKVNARELNIMEKQYEDQDKPMWTFARLIDELRRRKIIEKLDADNIKSFYKKIRIPIQHGLTRRFVRIHGDSIDDLFVGRLGRAHRLEEQIEDNALSLLETAISFMKKYAQPIAGHKKTNIT